jgi:transposase InsO family protein
MNYSDRDRATDPPRTTFADGGGLQSRQEQRGVFQPSDSSVEASGLESYPSPAVISDWKEDYNHRRRHSSLGYQDPAV